MDQSRVELFAAIRRDARAGLSKRALQRKHGVGYRTVAAALVSAWPQPRKELPRRASRLDPYREVIDGWLRDDLDAPRKQRHTAKRIYDRLLEGHTHAFRVLGGVPTGKIRYDNLKAAVAQVVGFSRQRVETERWTAYRSHYGLEGLGPRAPTAQAWSASRRDRAGTSSRRWPVHPDPRRLVALSSAIESTPGTGTRWLRRNQPIWAAACKIHGDAEGTRALIQVLLLHRHQRHEQVVAGIAAALKVGALTADAVALEARKFADDENGAGTPGVLQDDEHRSSSSTVRSLTEQRLRTRLPEDDRPLPSVDRYDQLLPSRTYLRAEPS